MNATRVSRTPVDPPVPGAARRHYGGDAAMPALFFAVFLVTTVLARRLRDRTA